MKIGTVGLGYIGVVTAAALAEQGHEIFGVDVDPDRIKLLQEATMPFHEKDIDKLFKSKVKATFSTDYAILKSAEVIFIMVNTPTVDSKIDLSRVRSAVSAAHAANEKAIIVIKSTVVPGTATELGRALGIKIISNPEFVSEGTAVENTNKPDRIVIGGWEPYAKVIEALWGFTRAPVIMTSNENAEMIKYASNAFLATKISYINEIANLCEKIPNADVAVIANGIGLDKRIGSQMLSAGIGFGGSCFPKDTAAFVSFAESLNERLSIVKAAINVNEARVERVVSIAKKAYGKELKSARICVLGLSFKKNTDDTRESQALKLISRLKKEGATLYAYDPAVTRTFEEVAICKTKEECIKKSEIIIIATDWEDFKQIMLSDEKILIDAKRILNTDNGKNFFEIGRNR